MIESYNLLGLSLFSAHSVNRTRVPVEHGEHTPLKVNNDNGIVAKDV